QRACPALVAAQDPHSYQSSVPAELLGTEGALHDPSGRRQAVLEHRFFRRCNRYLTDGAVGAGRTPGRLHTNAWPLVRAAMQGRANERLHALSRRDHTGAGGAVDRLDIDLVLTPHGAP